MFLLCFVVVSVYLYKKQIKLLTILLGFIFGFVLSEYMVPESELLQYAGEEIACIVEVQSIPNKTENGITFDGIVRMADGNSIDEKTTVFVSGDCKIKENMLVTFDSLKIKKPDRQKNFNSFDYQRYLKSQKIFVQCSADSENIKEIQKSKTTLKVLALKANAFLCNTVEQKFDDESAGLLNGILLGDKSGISSQTKVDFQNSGLSHVLAVSGLHLTIIVSILGIFLRRASKRIRAVILILCVWSFAFVVGLPASVVRAGFMLSVLLVADCLHLENDGLTVLALIALLLMIHNPYVVYDSGFTMSFSATLGILCMMPVFQQGKAVYIPTMLKECFALSFSAQIGIMPVLLLNFGRVNFIGMVANILIVVLIPAIYFVVLFAFLCRIDIFFIIASFLLKTLSWWASVCAKIPFGSFAAPFEPLFIASVFGISVFFLLLNSFKNKKISAIILGCLLVVACIGYRIGIAPPKDTQITFLSVGQADCAMLRTVTGETFLIDVGTERAADNEIVPYLHREGVTKLDGIFISHFDDDHCGGLQTIADSFEIEALFIPDTADVGLKQYQSLIMAKGKEISVVPMHIGDSVQSSSVLFRVLYPYEGKPDNHNASSLVVRADNEDVSVIFTGDLEKDSVLQNCDADILKVSHHGSANGSTSEFLSKCTPSVAVISLGENNGYGFPKQEVLSNLSLYTDYIYRTDLNGTIEISCDDYVYNIKTLR